MAQWMTKTQSLQTSGGNSMKNHTQNESPSRIISASFLRRRKSPARCVDNLASIRCIKSHCLEFLSFRGRYLFQTMRLVSDKRCRFRPLATTTNLPYTKTASCMHALHLKSHTGREDARQERHVARQHVHVMLQLRAAAPYAQGCASDISPCQDLEVTLQPTTITITLHDD